MQVMPAEFQSQGIPEGSWFDPATNILAGSTEIGAVAEPAPKRIARS